MMCLRSPKVVKGSLYVVAITTAILPFAAGAASNTASTTINATIASTITVSSSGTVNLAITPATGGNQTTASDSVSVSTNNAAGYNLRLASSTANTYLANGGNQIVANTGSTYASPLVLANNTWGYRVDVGGTVGAGSGFGAGPTTATTDQATNARTFAAMPASGSPQIIRNTAATASSEVTTVWYSAKADNTKPNGTYTAQVTYTATTN